MTLGRASEPAGMHRFEFESVLNARGILKFVEVNSIDKLKEDIALINSYQEEKEELKVGCHLD